MFSLCSEAESLRRSTVAKAKARKQMAKFWVIESRMQAPGGMLSLVLEKMNVHTTMIDS